MKKHRLYPFVVALLCAFAPLGSAATVDATDLNQGLTVARERKADVLLEFTGSDWCPPCKMLKSKILNTPQFDEFLKKENLVFVELDFPRTAGKVSAEVMKERETAMRRYGVRGFPSVAVLDAEGNPYGIIVGGAKTVDEYLQRLEEVRTVKSTFEADVAAAKKLTGAERAAALAAAVNKLPETCRTFQTDIVVEIIAADPEDRFGFAKRSRDAKLLVEQGARLEAFFEKYRAHLKPEELVAAREEALAFLNEADIQPAIRQALNKFISDGYALARDYPKALEYLKAAHAADPDSRNGRSLAKWIAQMEKVIEDEKARSRE